MTSLRQLAGQGTAPFELLAALEDRSRQAAVGTGYGSALGQDWVGVGFRLGGQRFVAAREDVREVLMPPSVTRVPGSRAWIRGLANVRGQLLPIVDLRSFLGQEEPPVNKQNRTLVVNHEEIPAGLIVDEILGFRRFADSQRKDDQGEDGVQGEAAAYVTGGFDAEDGRWHLFSLKELVESTEFLQAAE